MSVAGQRKGSEKGRELAKGWLRGLPMRNSGVSPEEWVKGSSKEWVKSDPEEPLKMALRCAEELLRSC